MNGSNLSGGQRLDRRLLVLLASGVVLASGCSNMLTTASGVNSATQSASVGGRIHGGNQPVAFATVNLYFAGQGAGIGAPATLAATTTSADDGYGSFSFQKSSTNGQAYTGTNTFSCPSTVGDPYVYVIATGGNTLNNHSSSRNSAAAFLAPLGRCSVINSSTFVNMSEVVTVATIAAVQQYFSFTSATGSENIGADGTFVADTALGNSFDTVSNMANLATGNAVASTTRTGTGAGAGVTLTVLPETAKINQIANIISSCVNQATSTSSTNCTTLFSNAVPPTAAFTSMPGNTYPTASNVLQAAYYMLANPTNGSTTRLNTLFGLAQANPPYQPTLTAAPTDWTIGIRYDSTQVTCGTSSAPLGFIYNAYDLKVDSYGSIWISNLQPSGSNLAKVSFNGTPQACVSIAGASVGGTIDAANNVWTGNAETNHIYRYNTTTTVLSDFPTAAPVRTITADGYGDVYFSTSAGNLYLIPGGSTAPTSVTITQINTVNIGATPAQLVVDSNNAVWASSGSSFISRTAPSVPPSISGNVLTPPSGFTTTTFNATANTYGIGVTYSNQSTNAVYTSSQGSSTAILSLLSGSGTTYSTSGPIGGFVSANAAGGLSFPAQLAVDGAQSAWVVDNGSSGISVFGENGVVLTPSGGLQKPGSLLDHPRSIVIDQSGNVWVGRDSSNSITEIVGAAVPIYQPFATGLPPNVPARFQTIP